MTSITNPATIVMLKRTAHAPADGPITTSTAKLATVSIRPICPMTAFGNGSNVDTPLSGMTGLTLNSNNMPNRRNMLDTANR